MISLVIGDDHRLFGEALSLILVQQGFAIPTVAQTVSGTIAAVRAMRPDVCLVDRSFPESDGLQAICPIIAASPSVKVVMLSADGSAESISRALEYGAVGYVHKTRGIAVLVESVHRVLDGEIVVDARPGPTRRHPRKVPDAMRLARYLTARERECLRLLVEEGMDTKAMAEHLGVATTTVRSHVQATLRKLGTHSRLEAAALAVRYGLIENDVEVGPARAAGSHAS
jgi:two-component system nitrate/nitrite response regulator NarL